jgi:hypothetical protein
MSPVMRQELEIDMPHWKVISWRTHLSCRRSGITYCVDKVFSPVAQVEEDILSSRLERVCHGFEAVEGHRWCTDTTHVVAAVVFEHVNAPVREALRIIDFVVQRSFYSLLAP